MSVLLPNTRSSLAMFALVTAWMLWPAVHADSHAYTLGVGDQLRVSVLGRPDLSGQFEVRASGAVSLPLLGEVQARGLTLIEFEDTIAAKLAAFFTDPPFVNLEIQAYRPFFIIGDVNRPGAYPYQNGMSVLRAIALAGGRLSPRDMLTRRDQREHDDAELLLEAYLIDVAREARLAAERDALEAVEFPDEFRDAGDDSRKAEIMRNEALQFDIRRETLAAQQAAIEKQVSAFREEISGLRAQLQAVDVQRGLVAAQLEDLETASARGAIPRAALLDLRLSAAGIERDAREIGVSITRAKLGTTRAENAIQELHDLRRTEVAEEVQAVQDRLSATKLRLRARYWRLDMMDSATPSDSEREGPRYYLRRDVNGEAEEIEVRGDAPLRPGDLIRVPFPSGGPGATGALELPARIETRIP